MNIFTDFTDRDLPWASNDDRPGADGLRFHLPGGHGITIYMDAGDAEIYANAINRAKLTCLTRRLAQSKPEAKSQASSPEKL